MKLSQQEKNASMNLIAIKTSASTERRYTINAN